MGCSESSCPIFLDFCQGDGEAAFRFASWNVLSPRQLSWSSRSKQIMDSLEELDPDIVALQEALPRCPTDSLDNAMAALGYSAHHREPDVDGIEPPVLYVRRATFRVIWEDSHQRTVGAILRPRAFKGPLVGILNVHLMGAPGEGKTRMSQVRKGLQRLTSQLDGESETLIVAGDFNETPNEGSLHRLLTTGVGPPGVDVPGKASEWAQWRFKDACVEGAESQGLTDAPLTWPADKDPQRRIDYIFSSLDLECAELPAPLAPHADYPSDHLLIAADLNFREIE